MFLPALLATILRLHDPAGVPTEPPVTYVLDYGTNHLDRADWLATNRAAPPELLHLGSDVPMTSNWGPVRKIGGENVAYGMGDFTLPISPDDVAQRMTKLTEMVRALHAAGVKMVMPYVCTMTIAGHHERRAGFWSFYDRWNDYAARFDLGPRPVADPFTWLQRKPDGEIHRFYTYTGDYYPGYQPNHRYAACVNNPAWQQWMTREVAMVARCGYDGVFTDNGGSQRCYCELCQKLFRDWAQKRGLKDDNLLHAPSKTGDARYAEAQRFWLENIHSYQALLRSAAAMINPSFKMFANGGHRRPQNVKLAFADSDFIMFEKSFGPLGTHPGLADGTNVNHNIVELKFVQCLRRRVKPIILTRSGYPKSQPPFEMNKASASLGCAEMAAFGNGGGFLIRPNLPSGAEVIRRWNTFHQRHAGLLSGNDSLATVGVAYWSEQTLFSAKHMTSVTALSDMLLASHVPFDFLMEENFNEQFLSRYSAIIMPDIAHADAARLAAVAAWARAGGRLLLAGAHPADSPLLAMTGSVTRIEKLPDANILGTWLRDAAAIVDDGRPELRRVYINLFARRHPARIVAHVLNYNTPLGVDALPPAPIENISLRIPLPRGLKPRCVTAFDADTDTAQALEWKSGSETLAVTLPRLLISKMILVELSPS
ncbi:MAG: hypothetical protein FJ395_12755 [Verrucomicrobia bacterium]|nr:hypothetical protein [Verrucomicrobiota bacterium]